MEIKNVTNQFVSFRGQETENQPRLGLVVGFVTRNPFGIRARIFDLEKRKMEITSLDDCRFVPKTSIIVPATVLKLFAWHKEFGQGIVAETRQPRGMMEVRLKNQAGLISDWFVLDDVMVIGPEP